MRTQELCRMTGIAFLSIVAVGLIWPLPAYSDIVDIDPFVGTHSENYDSISGITHQNLTIMDGFTIISNQTSGGAIKIEMNSQFNGDQVIPRSPQKIMGQLGIIHWEFAGPVTQFGSYFENNSGVDDAVIEFFDVGRVLLGSKIVTTGASSQEWTWNGWESDIPFQSAMVTGNSSLFLNGFIWYDDTRLTAVSVPEPTFFFWGLPACSLVALRRRRIRR